MLSDSLRQPGPRHRGRLDQPHRSGGIFVAGVCGRDRERMANCIRTGMGTLEEQMAVVDTGSLPGPESFLAHLALATTSSRRRRTRVRMCAGLGHGYHGRRMAIERLIF